MKKFRAFMLAVLAALSIYSCEGEGSGPLDLNTVAVEDILAAVSASYEVESLTETQNEYVLRFHRPLPIRIGGIQYGAIPVFSMPKSIVKQIRDTGSTLYILLIRGESYTLKLHSYLCVAVDAEALYFTADEMTQTVNYHVTESSKPEVKVECGSPEHFKATLVKSGDDGTIRFSAVSVGNFEETVNITFDNGDKRTAVPVRLVMANGSIKVDISYDFPEYARMFAVEVPDDVGVNIVVPEENKSWISTKIGRSLEGAQTVNSLFILLKENTGNSIRTGTVTITGISSGRNFTIGISQLGSEMDGSFKEALLDFYDALGGRNWFKRAGDGDERELHWNKDMQILDFYGLYPSRTAVASSVDPHHGGLVYFGTEDEWEIGLPFNGLRGTIPESFWDVCKYFTYIKINNCYLQDSRLSDKVWHDKLIGINFSHTYIGGSISSSALAKAVHLRLIDFNKCRISGEFPKAIAELKELERISFQVCDLTGAFPENIGNLSNLAFLDIGCNLNFGGTLPESFYDLANLHDFNAGLTKLGGHLSSRIAEMKNLRYFTINGCEFEGTIPEELGTLTSFAFDGENNYFTAIPEFVRYSGCENRWILIGGTFPSGVPSYQRKKETGRPGDMYVFDRSMVDEMTSDKYTDLTPFTFNYAKYTYYLPLPVWAHVRYNIVGWEKYIPGTKVKKPEWPYAEDLQYPANEYYYDKDRKAWCHPKLEYPAREYYKDSKGNWVHDSSCPWDRQYVYTEK